MPLYYEFRDDGVTEQPAEITIKVSPEEALADPTLLRDGRKRSAG